MLHRIAIGIALCMLNTLSIAQTSEVARVYFDFDKSELKAEGRSALMNLPRQATCNYVVAGHTDSRGTNDYNQSLSENRMEEVRLFLLDNGFPAAQIESQFFGEEQPWRLGEDEESWRMNRRVDVLCTCPDEEPPAVEAPIEEFVDELLAMLDARPDTYFVKADRDTVLYLRKGGILSLSAGCFEVASPDAEIEIRVKEYYTLSDMVLGNLNTRWRDKPLESGGMAWIEVFADGKSTDLKPGAEYELRIPTEEVKADMGLWYGTSGSANDLGWLPTGPIGGGFNGSGNLAPRLGVKIPGKFKLFMHRMFNRSQWAYWQRVIKEQEAIEEGVPEDVEDIKDVNESVVKYYVLTPQRFGYINCDRYMNSGRKLVAVKTSLEMRSNVTAQLIIPSDKSIMPAYLMNQKIGFPNIPAGKSCELVAFKVEDGDYFLGRKSFSADGEGEVEIEEWEQLDVEGLKARIKELDNA